MGSCRMSLYYLSAAKAERWVVRQAFGKALRYEWEGMSTLNTVERSSRQYMNSSLKGTGGILSKWTQQPGGSGAETNTTHHRL